MSNEISPVDKNLGVLLFSGFEMLDAYGPLSLFSFLPGLTITLVSEHGGRVAASGGPESWASESFGSDKHYDFLLVPGGMGTRAEVNNPKTIEWITQKAHKAEYCLSVCTGSALLAAACVFKGRRATSNKCAFKWASSQCTETLWQYRARWVQDGNIFTSSGVSAGMDMTLGFIAHYCGQDIAEKFAVLIEHAWHRDAEVDPFADCYQEP